MNNGVCYNSNEGGRPLAELCREMAASNSWLLERASGSSTWILLRDPDMDAPGRKHASFDYPESPYYQKYVIRDYDLPVNGGDAEVYQTTEDLWQSMGRPSKHNAATRKEERTA